VKKGDRREVEGRGDYLIWDPVRAFRNVNNLNLLYVFRAHGVLAHRHNVMGEKGKEGREVEGR
jgi:hypothetical protein